MGLNTRFNWVIIACIIDKITLNYYWSIIIIIISPMIKIPVTLNDECRCRPTSSKAVNNNSCDLNFNNILSFWTSD